MTAQSSMEAEFVATALKMKEAVFRSNLMKELGFETRFDNILVYINNTSTIYVTANQTYSLRLIYVVMRFFFIHHYV